MLSRISKQKYKNVFIVVLLDDVFSSQKYLLLTLVDKSFLIVQDKEFHMLCIIFVKHLFMRHTDGQFLKT